MVRNDFFASIMNLFELPALNFHPQRYYHFKKAKYYYSDL